MSDINKIAAAPAASGFRCPRCCAPAGQPCKPGCPEAGLASTVRKAIDMLAQVDVSKVPLAVPAAIGVLRCGLDAEPAPQVAPSRQAGKVKTWRERIGVGEDFPLHAPTDVERAMVAQIEDLEAALAQETAALLSTDELAALQRFNETCEDGEGYDVPKAMMQRLAAIGAVRRTSGNYYEITEFGMCVLEQPAPAPVPNPFLPMPAHRVDQLLLAYGSIEESRWGPENPKQYHTGLPGAVNLVRAVEQEVQARFAALGNCRRCEARGTYAGLVNKQLASVPCDDCGGTGKTAAAMQAQQITPAASAVLVERDRQVQQEGYDPEHDDAHPNGEIAAYAAFYAMPPAVREWPATETGYGATFGEAIVPADWMVPKTGDRRRELVKAGALILAEIERLDRAKGAAS